MTGRLKPAHPPLSLASRLMRVLHAIVQSFVSSMHGVGQQLSARRYIAGQLVRYHDARRIPRDSQQPLKKPSSGLLVSTRLYENIEDTAILVNGAPQILQAPVDLEVHLVKMPRVAKLSTSSANAFGVVPTKLAAPGADRFVSHGHSAFSH